MSARGARQARAARLGPRSARCLDDQLWCAAQRTGAGLLAVGAAWARGLLTCARIPSPPRRRAAVNYQISQTIRWEGKLQELFIRAVAACGGPFAGEGVPQREQRPSSTNPRLRSVLLPPPPPRAPES